MKIKCPLCDFKNEEDVRFCNNCAVFDVRGFKKAIESKMIFFIG